MSDTDPAVIRRLLALRQVAAFSAAGLDELAALAETAREVSFAAGEEVAAGNARVGHLQLVLDGRIEAGARASSAHELFGMHEALSGRPLAQRAVATMATQALQLSTDELADLVEDNIGVMVSLLRELARAVVAAHAPSPCNEVWKLPIARVQGGPLGLVERVILLRRQPMFARAHMQALFVLAHAATEQDLPVGRAIVRAGEPSDAAVFVIGGTLRSDGGETFAAGNAFGLTETLAALPHATTVTATAPARVLLASGTALFDVLEDHAGLGLAMLATLASIALDAAEATPTSAPSLVAEQGATVRSRS